MGEGGCINATPAIANAVIDALQAHRQEFNELPLTPERVRRLVEWQKRRARANDLEADVKFGVWIPSYCYPDMDYGRVQREVGDFSRKANDYGIDLWVIDHLLHAHGLYGMTWLEPMSVLTWAGAVAPDVKLGTGILVLPLRNPVLLAKEIATLDFLSGGRFLFGVGPGWYPAEFSSTGTNVKERGARTDEILEAVRLLLTEDDVTCEGRYYQFENVTIEPRPPKMPEVWVAGGRPRARPRVQRRADARADGAAAHPQGRRVDLALLRQPGVGEARLGGDQGRPARAGAPRRRDPLLAHQLHVPGRDVGPREGAGGAEADVRRGDGHAPHLRAPAGVAYLLGSLDDIIARLKEPRVGRLPVRRLSARRATTSGSST